VKKTSRKKQFSASNSVADSLKLCFLHFLIFDVKLGHFTIFDFFLYLTNMQAYQQKTEKFFVGKEKRFYRIGFQNEFLCSFF